MPTISLIEALDVVAPAAVVSLLLLAGLLSGAVPALRFASGSPRPEPAWTGRDVVAVGLFYVGVSIIAGVTVASLRGGEAVGLTEVEVGFAGQLVVQLATIGVILALVGRTQGDSRAALGLRRTPARNVIPAVLLLAFAMIPLQFVHLAWVLGLTAMRGALPVDQAPVSEFRDALAIGSSLDVVLLVIMAVVLAPLTEELLFRGVLFGWLRARASFWPAALASSFLFALVHGSEGVLVPILVVGLLLAFVYEATGSLLTAMLFHALFNAAQLVQLALGHEGGG